MLFPSHHNFVVLWGLVDEYHQLMAAQVLEVWDLDGFAFLYHAVFLLWADLSCFLATPQFSWCCPSSASLI